MSRKNKSLIRSALYIAGFLVILYYAAVISTSFLIYKNTSNSFTRFTTKIFPYPAAVVERQIIPLSRFEKEVAALTYVRTKKSLTSSDSDIRKSVMTRLSDNALYKNVLKRHGKTVTDADTEALLTEQAEKIGGKENLEKFIKEEYGGELSYQDFKIITKELLIRSVIEKEILFHVHVNHILIAVPENASEKDITNAKKRIDDVKTKITDHTQFGSIAKQHSEDVVSRDKNGDLGTTSRGPLAKEYSKEFEDALFNLALNTVSEPIRSKHGWHLLLVDKREGTINDSLEHYTEELRKATPSHVFVAL